MVETLSQANTAARCILERLLNKHLIHAHSGGAQLTRRWTAEEGGAAMKSNSKLILGITPWLCTRGAVLGTALLHSAEKIKSPFFSCVFVCGLSQSLDNDCLKY